MKQRYIFPHFPYPSISLWTQTSEALENILNPNYTPLESFMQARHCSGIPTPGGITSKPFPIGDVFRLSHYRSLTYRCLCKLRPKRNTAVCGKKCSCMSCVWVIGVEHIQIRCFCNTFFSLFCRSVI